MRTLPLNTFKQVVLDGSGNGGTSIGPTSQGEIWEAGFTAAVKCTSNIKEAACLIYCGDQAADTMFNDGTTWGSTGDSSTNTAQLVTGQQVFAVWTGGDPGATATLSVSGSRIVG